MKANMPRPASWVTLYPPNRHDMWRVMQYAGVTWPHPVLPIQPGEKPVKIPSLQNHVLHVQRNGREKASSFFWINQHGEWANVKCIPYELSQITETLGITYTPENKFLEKVEAKILLPDYIGDIPVDKPALQYAINHSLNRERDAWFERHMNRRCVINGVTVEIFNQPTAASGQKRHALEKLTGGYMHCLLSQIVKQPELLNTDLHDDYTRIMNQLVKSNNKWMVRSDDPSVMATSNQSFVEDEDLPIKNPEVWGLLTKINSPRFYRTPDNKNTKTFDYIEIHFGIRSSASLQDRDAFIKSCIRDIIQIGLIKIRDSSKFKSYGVPINFLKATRYVITRQDEIVLTYELKIKN